VPLGEPLGEPIELNSKLVVVLVGARIDRGEAPTGDAIVGFVTTGFFPPVSARAVASFGSIRVPLGVS
tara:strand:+ start:141 stop:344 length:204 start_codon:yes stop_codon:yes gene_type:complete